MPGERPGPTSPRREDTFGFSEREVLFDRISHERFMGLFEAETTTIHQVVETSNTYGEFLFVTLSKPGTTGRVAITLWGLGYHEYRERWLSDEWRWYFPNRLPEEEENELPKAEAQELLQQRLAYVQAHATNDTQTRRGELFELIADLTDEDGAWAEMDELSGWLFDDEI